MEKVEPTNSDDAILNPWGPIKFSATNTSPSQLSEDCNDQRTRPVRAFLPDLDSCWRVDNLHPAKHCTDILWLCVFLLYFAGMVATAAYAFKNGNVYRLIHQTDSFGNICGRNNEYITVPEKHRKNIWLRQYVGQDLSRRNEVTIIGRLNVRLFGIGQSSFDLPNKSLEKIDDLPADQRIKIFFYALINCSFADILALAAISEKKPHSVESFKNHFRFAFFLDATQLNSSLKICVEKCPDENVEPKDLREFVERTANAFCMPHGKDSVHAKLCPIGAVYKSTERLMLCVPDVVLSKPVSSYEFGRLMNSVYMLLQFLIADLVTVRFDILPFCAFSLGLAILMAFILQFLSSVLISLLYILITLITVGFVSFCWYSWYLYYLRVRMNPRTQTHPLNMTCYLLLILLASVSLAMLVILATIWYTFPRNKQLYKFFRKAGQALRENTFLIILPLTTSLITTSIFVACIVISFFLFSTAPGKLVSAVHNGVTVPTVAVENTRVIRGLWWFLVIGTVWAAEFTYACNRYIIAGTIVAWYRNRKVPCCAALRNLFCFHIGSLAFGSIIIAMIRTPRSIILCINAKLRSCGKCAGPLFILVTALTACLERPIRHLHHIAYTVIALKGFNFCHSAKVGMKLLMENASDASLIHTNTVAVIGITKALVATIVAVCAGFWFHYRYNLNTSFLAVFLVGYFAYLIAARFLSVFEINIDTLFVYSIINSPSEEKIKMKHHSEQRNLIQNEQTSMRFITLSEKKIREEVWIGTENGELNIATGSVPNSPPPSYIGNKKR